MGKSIAVEEKLARVSAIDLQSPGGATELAAALKDKSNLVIARAANRAAKADLQFLSDELAAAFTRLMAGGMAADRGCSAKQAISHALYQFGTGSAELFLAGIHHVQMEPVYGEHSDTAPQLRGTCALGLVRIGYRDALMELTDLLGDPEPQARIMAARALAYSGSEFAALPLRLKLLAGDPTLEVIGECFAALLKLTPASAVPLIGRFLRAKEMDIAAEAAMALASSRLDSAADLLLDCWRQNPLPELRELLASPLAMTRRTEAIDLLMEVIERGSVGFACSVLEALALYRGDASLRERALCSAAGREREVKAAAARAFS